MYTGMPALSFSIFATSSSAGGQLEQPSEVNSSTTAKPLASAGAFFKSFAPIKPVEASIAAGNTTARANIFNDFIVDSLRYCVDQGLLPCHRQIVYKSKYFM